MSYTFYHTMSFLIPFCTTGVGLWDIFAFIRSYRRDSGWLVVFLIFLPLFLIAFGLNVSGKFNEVDVFTDARYFGEVLGNQANGKGTKFDLDGNMIYQGDFKSNKYDGYGILRYPDGARYEGNFKNGQKEGYGTYYHTSGVSYTGTFSFRKIVYKENGKTLETYVGDCVIKSGKEIRCGRGIAFYENDRYEGEYFDDRRHGPGVYYYGDGRVEYRKYRYSEKVYSKFR